MSEAQPGRAGRLVRWLLLGPLASVALVIWLLVSGRLRPMLDALVSGAGPALVVLVLLLLIRDVVLDVGRWRAALLLLGHRVPWADLTRIHLAGAGAKALLPAKLGEGVRVWRLRDELGVPLEVGGAARLGSLLALAAALGLALAFALGAPWSWLGGGALAVLLGLAVLLRAHPGAALGLAVFAAASLVIEVVVWVLAWQLAGPGSDVPVEGILVTVTASQLPVGLRGVGLRESVFSAWASTPEAGAVALAVSMAELLTLACVVGLGALYARRVPAVPAEIVPTDATPARER